MAGDTQPVSREALKREAERLRGELVRLRRKVDALSGEEAVDRSGPQSGLSDAGTATDADLDRALTSVRQNLADLTLAVNRLTPGGPPRPGKSHRKRVSESGAVYRIRPKGEVQNRTVTIQNRGQDVVVNPRVVVNGRRDWFSAASILKEALEPGMSKREVAIAIWRFLKDNRYHNHPGRHDEVCDPVRFLNVYGYGLCGVSATNFMLLCEQAGLKARVWGLSGHVVPEAHFDGSWHMLDPDGEIYYLDDDGETISSVATLEQRSDIIRKYPSPYYTDADNLVRIYTTTEDNRRVPHYEKPPGSWHTLSYTLRPGESLMRSWDNWGRYFVVDRKWPADPARYGNGRWTFEPVFKGGLFRKGAESVRGVRVEQTDGGRALAPSRPGRQGVLVYRFASPYPFLDGTVEVAGEIEGKGRLGVAFSEDGEVWQTVWSEKSAGRIRAGIPMGRYFPNGYLQPVYTYFLKVTLSAPEGGGVQVRRLQFSSDVQVAPHSLPALEAGENEVRYVDETAKERDVEVVFGYDTAE